MPTRHVADGEGHRHDREAEGERHAEEADADLGERRRQNGAATTAEHEPERAEKLCQKFIHCCSPW
ncbi:hypothetical protein D3C83_210950 [compost metagenome]